MTRIKDSFGKVLVSLMSIMACSSFAEDIDLFTGINPNLSPPTVLLVWHSTANSSAAVSSNSGCVYSDPDTTTPSGLDGEVPALGNDNVGGMEQCAMVNTLLSLKTQAALLGNIKVGLMMFNETGFQGFDNGTSAADDSGDNNGNNKCGFLVSSPVLMDSAGINAFANRIANLTHSNLANNSRVGDTVAEAWSMLNGLDYSCSGVSYDGLADVATECRDAVMVYIGNATKENSSVSDGTEAPDELLKTELTSRFPYDTSSEQYLHFTDPMAVTSLNNSGSENNTFWGDEWSQFMKHVNPNDRLSGQGTVRNVTTYSIAVYDPEVGNIEGEINFYGNMATKGGGKSFLVNKDSHASLQEVLLQIFGEVQAVNSVFSSATLPVSANTQGTFLNQVYIAMFRPDEQSQPRWYGNLKQYQLGFDAGGGLVLTDADQDPTAGPVTSATNPNTGTVVETARSFWTTNSPDPAVTGWPENSANGTPDGYWRNSPEGAGFNKDSPDGDLVEKGGAAQMLRVDNLTATYATTDGTTENSRTIYTCDDIGTCATGGLTDFKTNNASLDPNNRMDVSTSSSQSGVTMTAGSTIEAADAEIIDCAKGQGNERFCNVTFSRADTGIANGDSVDTNAADDGCSAGAPCQVRNVVVDQVGGTTSFQYVFSGGSTPAISNVSATFYLGDNTISATATGHGLAEGDTSVLSSCQNTSPDVDGQLFGANDTGGLPSSGTREVTIASVSGDNFTFSVPASVFAVSAANVNCTITTGLNAETLIKWVRGEDNAGNEVDAGPCDGTDCSPLITVRPSVHGDVLHSRPAVINYGGTTGAVVYYGANDGVFHAINGNQEDSISGVRPGGELWGFVAPEFFGKLKRLHQNEPLVELGSNSGTGFEPRDYFFDGTTTILQDNRSTTDAPNTGGKKYIFLSSRRGGPLLYALDVTDPLAPSFLWSKSNSDIGELGQTWSQPKVALVEGRTDPVVIFGAGYDLAEDVQPGDTTTADDDTTIDSGRGVVVLDAKTGDLIWAALADCTGVTGNCVDDTTTTATLNDGTVLNRLSHELTDPMPADVALLDNDFDGSIDRLYAADTGGNIWRVDLAPKGDTDPSKWIMTKFASLGGTGNDDRKFLFSPDAVLTTNEGANPFDIVVASSGDREHPLYDEDTTAGRAYNVNNRFYVLIDKNGGDSVPAGYSVLTESTLVDRTDTKCLNAGNVVDCSYDAATDSYKDDATNEEVPLITLNVISGDASMDGYYITLEGDNIDGDSEGEKGINAPLVVAGKAFFGTNQPDVPVEGQCTASLGIARGYRIDLFTGAKNVNVFAGGGMPPSPIAGLVTIGDETVPFIIGGEGPSAFDPSTPTLDLDAGRKRTYWYYK